MVKTSLYNSVLVSKYFSRFFSISLGEVLGEWRSTGFPFLSTMNLVKFHLMASIRVPPCSFFKYLNNGCASFPLTSILSNKSKFTLRSFTKHWISSALPGSWWPNWLQGKARIRKPVGKRRRSLWNFTFWGSCWWIKENFTLAYLRRSLKKSRKTLLFRQRNFERVAFVFCFPSR